MCRHAAYIGPPIPLYAFLSAPAHSLLVQSYASRELESAVVCADGFGVGGFGPDGTPFRYRSTMPIWSDPNLDDLGAALTSPVWVANVRSATPPLPVSHENTHPFAGDGLLFSHNGFIEDFTSIRRTFRQGLDRFGAPDVAGSTDSEHLFALLRHVLRREGTDMTSAFRTVFGTVAGMLREGTGALLNAVVAESDRITASRHALGGRKSPSLYVARGHRAFGGGHLVASEPLDDDASWTPVREGATTTLTVKGVESGVL